MFRVFLKWTALFFLVVESLGLIASLLEVALKIAHWNETFSRVSWGETALEPTLRLAIVGLILSAYLHLRSVSRLPLTITRQSALLEFSAVGQFGQVELSIDENQWSHTVKLSASE